MIRFTAEPLLFEDLRVCRSCNAGDELGKSIFNLTRGEEETVSGQVLNFKDTATGK